jgi:hypothetical protein
MFPLHVTSSCLRRCPGSPIELQVIAVGIAQRVMWYLTFANSSSPFRSTPPV